MRRSLALPAALVFATLAALPAAAQDRGVWRAFGDWLTGCDQTRACRAMVPPAEGAEPGAALVIDRGGAPDDLPRIEFNLSETVLPERTRIVVAVDGRTVLRLAVGTGLATFEHTPERYALAAARDVSTLIAAIRRGRSLTLRTEGRTPALRFEMSLAGLSASLLFVDERQNRLDTTTALIRTGRRLPATIPPRPFGDWPNVPDAPAESDVPPEAIAAARELHVRDGPCVLQEAESDDVQAHRLTAERALIGLLCGRGAYSFTVAYYLVEVAAPHRIERARFAFPVEEGPEPDAIPRGTQVLTDGDFHRETSELTFFARGRGIGDCGAYGTFRFDGEAFRPLRLAMMPRCRGLLGDPWIEPFAGPPPAPLNR